MSDDRTEIRAAVRELARLTVELIGRPASDADRSTATITRADLCRICDEVAEQSAEIARLTAELATARAEIAAARAVPPDAEAAIDAYAATVNECGDTEGARRGVHSAVADAIDNAVADFIDIHAKRITGDDWMLMDADDQSTVAGQIHDVLNHLRADEDDTVRDGRKVAAPPATVGGLLATVNPGTVTWRAPNPLTADGVLDWMHGDICEEFDEADDLADRMHVLGMAKRERLDEMLTAAWEAFVDEAGLTELHTTDGEG